MRQSMLSEEQAQFLREEKEALSEIRLALAELDRASDESGRDRNRSYFVLRPQLDATRSSRPGAARSDRRSS